MRTFDDNDGNAWQAALMEASFGSILLVFSPMRGNNLRCAPMGVLNMVAAQTKLLEIDEDELRTRLEAAPPWDPATA